MATATFTNISQPTTDQHCVDYCTKLINALGSMPDLTRITNQVNQPARQSALNTSYGGNANLDPVNKTFTGGTLSGTNSWTLTGAVWSTPLADSDVGRAVKIVNSAGTIYTGHIVSVNVGTNTVVVYATAAFVAGTAGLVTGTVGVIKFNDSINNFFYGYLIYRFNDALQATSPVFIKIYVGMWAGAGYNSWALLFEVGTGVDGNGNLTGTKNNGLNAASADQWKLGTTTSGSPQDAGMTRTHYVSAGAGRLSIIKDADSANTLRGAVTISRGIDGAGLNTGEYVQFLSVFSTSKKQILLHFNTGLMYPSETGWTVPVIGSLGGTYSTLVYNGNTSVMPIQPLIGRLRPHAGDMILAKKADFPLGSTTIVNGRTYISYGQDSETNVNITGSIFLVRYE